MSKVIRNMAEQKMPSFNKKFIPVKFCQPTPWTWRYLPISSSID
jgi:hypothetical protein